MIIIVGDIIGCLSSIITIEEAGRTWIKEMKEKKAEGGFDFQKYVSENGAVNRNLDHLKQWLSDNENLNIFTKDEIQNVKETIVQFAQVDYYEKEELNMIIDELFSGINKYISDNLSVGAKIIINQCNRQEELLDRIDKRTEMLNSEIGSKENARNRYITEIAPNPPSKFRYREKEINDIISLMQTGQNISIMGIGGIGKTSILRYMYKYQMDCTDFYLGWITYSGNLKNDVMDNCILFGDILDINEKENALRSFSRDKNKNIILFIDNVTEEIQKDSFWDFLIKTVKVYISTRQRLEEDAFVTYEVESICPDDALKLFWDYYGEKGESAEEIEKVTSLIKKINYHTLMIEMIAKAAKFAEESLTAFIDKLDQVGFSYSQDEIKTGHNKTEKTVVEHLARLYKLEINSKQQNHILYNFAIMKNFIVPFEFRRWINENDDNQNKKTFNELIKRGWIKKEKNGYSMHPVIKESINAQGKIHVYHALSLIKSINESKFFDENLDSIKINQRINIAESILDYYAPYDGDDDIVMEIMENFILACSMQSRFEEGKYFAEKQLDWSCEKNENPYNDNTAEALLNLARICFAARKFNDAREFCDALYVICNKIYDSNDIRLFTFREIFIQVCVEQKDYDLADAEYLRADLMDNPKITEERKLNIKMAFCSMLINKFLDVTIKNVMPYENAEKLYLDEAEKILRQIYPYSLNKYGENHLEMLIWYQNMANIYNYRGQYYDALSFDRKIVKVREQKLGKMNGQLAAAYYNLADDCFKIANVEKKSAHDALDYIEKADEIISKVYPDSQMERNTKELIIRIKEYQANYNFA